MECLADQHGFPFWLVTMRTASQMGFAESRGEIFVIWALDVMLWWI
jgi:hypothetical protein